MNTPIFESVDTELLIAAAYLEMAKREGHIESLNKLDSFPELSELEIESIVRLKPNQVALTKVSQFLNEFLQSAVECALEKALEFIEAKEKAGVLVNAESHMRIKTGRTDLPQLITSDMVDLEITYTSCESAPYSFFDYIEDLIQSEIFELNAERLRNIWYQDMLCLGKKSPSEFLFSELYLLMMDEFFTVIGLALPDETKVKARFSPCGALVTV
jgi:hypothetical protein